MVITAAVSKLTHPQNNQEHIDTMEEDGSLPGSPRSSSPSKSTKTKKPIDNGGVSATVCANCGTTTTPLWRRAPNGDTICNACGLYMKARNAVRPHWLKRNTPKKSSCSSEAPGTCPGDGHCNGTGGSKSCSGCPTFNQHQINRQSLICANCNTTTTPLWRRDEAGATICNACGLYYKLHGRHRPVSMKRSVIKRRKRMANGSGHADDRDNSDEEDSEDDKSIGEHYSESAGSVPASPKEAPLPKDKANTFKSTHTSHKDHHDHDPNSCNHDQCRQNATRAGYVPALEDYGKPIPKKSLKSSDLKRMPNKLLGRESEHKTKESRYSFNTSQDLKVAIVQWTWLPDTFN
ncbi:Suppressor of ferric uptake 1 [Basidiobolus ranarum]|uniref:Suppressor of ferric uptake 1 n=1 Tax=Basidiobolus ranarum TaxID=34480 RepID=A0ABR2WTM8_9FUNG